MRRAQPRGGDRSCAQRHRAGRNSQGGALLTSPRPVSGAVQPWAAEFTYGYLHRLVEAVRSRFEPRPLRDGPGDAGDPPRAILRHDVDVSLRRAIALAEREAEWGVTASYMVQADCPLYRVDVAPGRERLGRLRELGHEVGLHVDLGSVADDEEAAARRVRAAAEKLGDVLGMPIESVSFHRPGRSLLHGPDRFAGLVNAYGKSMMTSYISDSQGRWRHGEPLPQIQAGSGRFLQILIHPIWWGESHRAPESRLRDFFERETAGLSPSEIEAFDAELGTAVGSVWPGRPK